MLKFNLKFTDLYDVKGLKKLDKIFDEYFLDIDEDLFDDFKKLSKGSGNFDKKERDNILIESAKIVEDFLAELFNIEDENNDLRKSHKDFDIVAKVKRDYVQRKISKKFKDYEEISSNLLSEILDENVDGLKITEIELELARKIDEGDEKDLKNIEEYSRWALFSENGQKFHEKGALFNLPQKIDYENLVDEKKCQKHPIKRDGFDLFDRGFDLNKAVSEANYCIFCHNQEKDSCRTGLKNKKSDEFVDNELGVKLEGCPLDQKISEMNLLKSQGFALASMIVAAIDNPLMAATGHRICNDCMKSCIFQKQDPVNIPQIESENLKDVLQLPYGFEIYSLISRWNPLNFEQKIIKERNKKRVLVAGLGPAGFALSYYLLNKGYDVVAIDGLKIEPMNPNISGINQFGERKNFEPIKDISKIKEDLSTRVIQGFGGVCEYGITSRWDKNFLTVIRLLLERRANFRMFGGVRFGSSINDEIAFNDYDFDHIALCIGAGRPNIIDLKNNFCKGVRLASDFLMNLQLGGAFKEDLFTNLQVRAPIIVIGAGLTGVDTATEAQEYYVVQIKKFKKKIDILEEFYGSEKFWRLFSDDEKKIADEFLEHEKILSEKGKEFLFEKIGKTKIVYRKRMQDSPAYKQNHEELNFAIRQGIEFVQNKTPIEVVSDENNYIKSLKFTDGDEFKCGSLFIAAGTAPNISIVDQDKMDLNLDEKYFAQIDLSKNKLQKNKFVKHGQYSFFTKINDQNKSISFFGDLHPNFEGNVVRAIASAKIGHRQIDEFLSKQEPARKSSLLQSIFGKKRILFERMNRDFVAKLNRLRKMSDTLNEVEIKAPLLAKKSEIGHIFRLQNFYNLSEKVKDQTLMSEGMALTATRIDKSRGLISGTLLDYGGSTSLVRDFKEGQPCIFMGPSGKKTKMFENETLLLLGSGRGNAVLARIAEKFKENGCKIILCQSFKDEVLVNNIKESQKFTDSLVISVIGGISLKPKRISDFYSSKEVIACLRDYFKDHPQEIDRVFVIGNDKFAKRIADAKKNDEVKEIARAKSLIFSLNAPMQCMMKGVCSQCLQKRVNADGNEEFYYSCADQDQIMETIDFKHLTNRCDQNQLQEKVTQLWIRYLRG